ncbi:MAG: efflux RND transporter periplasmic adaptor subunit [Rikenellaceae bacterium]
MSRTKTTLLILFALVFTSCKYKKKGSELPPPPKVETAITQVDSLYNTITVATQINGLNNAVVQPRINGFLVGIHFTGGEIVKKGDILFTIDPAPFSAALLTARAALESARASEILAQRNYLRAEPLAQIDAISQSDLDQYRATYKSATASTTSAEENLRSAELEIGYTKIYAPISGVASKTTAVIGDYIGPGTLQSSLTTVSQLDTITVDIPISTAQYLDANSANIFDDPSLLSSITLILPDSSQYNYRGEYFYTLKDTPTASSLVVIAAKFPNPDLRLKEGMFARVTANLGNKRGCIVVPQSAISQLQGVNSLWVIKSDTTAEWRRVELGAKYGTLWAVTDGVEEGEYVVVSGGSKLHNGIKVAATIAK